MLHDARSECCLRWWDIEEIQDSFEINLCDNTLLEACGHLYSTGSVCGWIMCVNVNQNSTACCIYMMSAHERVHSAITSATLSQWITQTILFRIPPGGHRHISKSWKPLTTFLSTPAVFQCQEEAFAVCSSIKITYSTFEFLFWMCYLACTKQKK